MTPFKLERIQLLPISIGKAWDFFSDPRNLSSITPPDLGFSIVTTIPEKAYAGMVVSYTVTPFARIAVDWTTEITHLREPDFFVDEQRFGPYRFWHHQHLFKELDNSTEMTDIVHYLLPFHPFGQLAAGFVRKKLDTIFDFRRIALEKKLGSLQ